MPINAPPPNNEENWRQVLIVTAIHSTLVTKGGGILWYVFQSYLWRANEIHGLRVKIFICAHHRKYICWIQIFKMEDIPVGFILFHSPYDYSQACSFCSDFDLDVLEIYIHGFCCLTFFSLPEFHACRAFCIISDFHVEKYIPL